MRISNSQNIEAYIYSLTEPALEKSTNIKIAPFMMTFPSFKASFFRANLKLTENNWSQVYDFDYDPDKGNLNWTILKPSECKE